MGELAVRLGVPRGPQAPTAARHAVLDVLHRWNLQDQAWLDSAAVVISELVTNAVMHGTGHITVAVQMHEAIVTLSVADASPALPHHRDPDLTGGRGLPLIEALSTRWGVLHDQNGKRVWAELPPCPPAPQLAGTAGRYA